VPHPTPIGKNSATPRTNPILPRIRDPEDIIQKQLSSPHRPTQTSPESYQVKMVKQYNFLSQDQIDHFMKFGYLRIENAFSLEKASSWTEHVWTRLGYDPNDKSTWNSEKINMPNHKFEPVSTFSPKAWGAICELCGGEDRVDDASTKWSDGLIVNLGAKEWENNWQKPKELTNWHVDGDFFVHFLDSREQALLVIPVFTEILPQGGGTMICPEGIPLIAKHLYDRPEGVMPGGFEAIEKIQTCEEFHEVTGKPGDVVLMHPFMLHSASRNALRIPRIITNPPVLLKEPFNFDRENPDDYSLIEKKTLAALGKDRLPGWKITGERKVVVPARVRIQAEMRAAELKRMNETSNVNGAQTWDKLPTTAEILSM
jgi:Phytanoyl-CoA dioxygenase (PhyH)